MPTFWHSMCPTGLHQDPKATCCSVEKAGNATDHLHRWHPHPGRVQGVGTGPYHRPSIFAREPTVCDKQTQVCPTTYTVSGVPRPLSKFSSATTVSSAEKVKKIRAETRCPLEGGQVTARKLSQLLGRLQAATRAIPLAPLFYCKLQQALQERAITVRTELFIPINPLHRGEWRDWMVVGSLCLPGTARPSWQTNPH